MRIHILTLNGVFDTGLATVLDTFSTANSLAAMHDQHAIRFDVILAAVRSQVHTAQGLRVPSTRAAQLPPPDVVLVPALGSKTPDALQAALNSPEAAAAGKLLRQHASHGSLLCAACTSTFLLADTTLLDGHQATTTWWLAPLFRSRYPKVTLDESRMVVEADRCLTAGAALAHLDLALALIRRSSPALAALTARYLVVDPRPSQAAYAIPDHLAHADPIVERFEHWARRQLAHGFSLPAAARTVGTSERTLARRLQHVLGKSPLAYFQDLRVEHAIHLLQTTHANIEQIAAQVGYADGVTLRTLLRRKTGRGIKELRGRGLAGAGLLNPPTPS